MCFSQRKLTLVNGCRNAGGLTALFTMRGKMLPLVMKCIALRKFCTRKIGVRQTHRLTVPKPPAANQLVLETKTLMGERVVGVLPLYAFIKKKKKKKNWYLISKVHLYTRFSFNIRTEYRKKKKKETKKKKKEGERERRGEREKGWEREGGGGEGAREGGREWVSERKALRCITPSAL